MRLLSIEPRDFQERIEEGEELVVIDIRQEDEKLSYKLEDSFSIPVVELPSLVDYLFGLGPLVVICNSGYRSSQVAEWMRSLGLNVHFLDGGATRLKIFKGD